MTTSNPRIEVKDAAPDGWFGAREEAQLPVRTHREGSPATAAADEPLFTSDARVWLRRARRAAIDLAIVLAAMTAVPVLFVATSDATDWRSAIDVDNIREKVAGVEHLRALRVAVDPAITPLEAGTAFSELNPLRRSEPAFRLRSWAHPAMTWKKLRLPLSLYPDGRWAGDGPSSVAAIQAAARGLSAEETAYLRQLASAPVWDAFDLVARAGSIDVIGARFVLPFSAAATIRDLPGGIYSSTKEVAYAAVSRAAYHLAIGQRDSAETILRSIVSFGFNLEDSGSGLVDQMVGRSIVTIGRDGLESFYTVTNDPRLAVLRIEGGVGPTAAVATANRDGSIRSASSDAMRRELIARAADPNEIQGIRYASLDLLQSSVCTNVRELLLGRRADVSDAFRRAKTELARFPSQQALIDLIQRSPETDPIEGLSSASPLRKLLYGTSAIAGTVLHNPRLAACMWHVTEGKPGF